VLSVPFDPQTAKARGEPTVILQGVRTVTIGIAGIAIWKASSTGTIAYDAGTSSGRLVIVDRSGQVTALTDEPRRMRMPRASPDGNRIAIEIAGSGRDVDLWIFDRRTGTSSRFSADGRTSDALWSNDGTRLAFARRTMQGDRQLGIDMFEQRIDRSSGEDTLVVSETNKWPWNWTPDGKTVVYDEGPPGRPTRIMSAPADGSRAPQQVVENEYVNRIGRLSPDGKWIAYTSNESGRVDVYIRPFPGPGASSQISTEGGNQPMWSRNGKELYYREGNKMMAAVISTAPEVRVTSRTPLFEDRFLTSNATNYDVLPDGRFVMIESTSGSAPQLFVIVNWKPPVGR
jgi:Tol biopolymer transport system component